MALILSQGPMVLLVIGQSLVYCRESIVPMILGVISGNIVVPKFCLLGVYAVLSTSAFFFNSIKCIGAITLT